MDLFVATLIIQEDRYAARRAAARYARPAPARDGLLAFFGARRTR